MIHILKISPHLTARTVKQIQGLLESKSFKISIVVKSRFNHLLKGLRDHPRLNILNYSYRNNFVTRFSFKRYLKSRFSDVDIIHCHNEPNYPIVDAIKVFKDKIPVMYDIHDMTSCRTGKKDPEERYAYMNSDAIIHVSHEFIEIGDRYYGSSNTHYLYSSASEESIISPAPHSIDFKDIHFVYQGGIFDPTWKGRDRFQYRNYYPIFEEILKEGHHIHLFTSVSRDRLPSYQNLAEVYPKFHIEGHCDYKTLVTSMNTYDVGLAGFNFDNIIPSSKEYLNGAMGNKLFDYLCAGLPVIVVNASAMAHFVKENTCGAEKIPSKSWTSTASELPRVKAQEVAAKYSAEQQTKKLADIYHSLLKEKK